ncbi:aspartate-semialdehyde dehydrogenase [bacterium]|nr:aspartate-semialdehyde dehydrogenase [bacterium]
MKIAVVGATGMVGRTMLQVLEERSIQAELIPVASERTRGSEILWNGMSIAVQGVEEAVDARPDYALFSAGGALSEQWAPRFAEVGCTVIDNSSAWRMDPQVPLVVPEVNGSIVKPEDLLIANPNCSTIQLVMVLEPLRKAFGMGKVLVSTYQSVTGTGQKAVAQMEAERAGLAIDQVYPHPIDRNLIPHCDVFLENGFTKEEMKLTRETVKILGDPGVLVSATAVRVPVTGGHSESVYVELQSDFTLEQVHAVLASMSGVKVYDHPEQAEYPMPLLVQGQDEVWVGRIRRDLHHPRGLHLFIAADNLRKGAATNAVQILEYCLRQRAS